MPAKNTDKPKQELPKVEPTREEWERFTGAVRKVATANPPPKKTTQTKAGRGRNSLSSFESLDDTLSQASKLTKRCNDWLVSDRTPFVERYLRREVKIAIRRVDAGPRYYGAIFEAWPLRGSPKSLCPRLRTDDGTGQWQVDGEQSLVFPRYVEVVKSEEKIIPSVVRLQVFDDLPLTLGQPLFTFRRVHRVDEALVRSVNRKVTVGMRCLAVALSERSGEQVQASSNAVDDRSGGCVQRERERTVNLQLEQLLPHLLVRLFDQEEWGSVEPGFESLFEGWELGHGPIDGSIGI